MLGQPAASTRSVTAEIIAAIVVALIFIFLFLDVPVAAKIVLILILATVGTLNFVALVGWTAKLREKLRAWRSNRSIRKYPDLVAELYRLNRKIHKVLYERNAENASLAMQGIEAVKILSKEIGDDDSLPAEFGEKFDIMQTTYNQIWAKIVTNSTIRHRWKTLEFAEILGLVSVHLVALGNVFKTVYRGAELFTERGNFVPDTAQNNWNDFVRDFNPVLQEWKTFTEKVAELVGGWGVDASRSELAKDI